MISKRPSRAVRFRAATRLSSSFWVGSAVAVLAGLAWVDASPVQTRVSSTTELAYAGDVSATDLLHGLTATTAGNWKTSSGASPTKLNDGVHGNTNAVDSASSVAWANPGASATFNLGSGGGFGWDITSIQSIAAWVSVGFGNQAYTVSVRYMGDTAFTELPALAVSYQPLTTGGNPDPGATKVLITDSAGPLISGIDAIRFTALSVNGGLNAGGFTFREIDVQGVQATGPADVDGDGMPDSFELAHTSPPSATALLPHADLEHDGAGDGLTNLQEYEKGTDPNHPDTDGDTLEDGAEAAGAGSRPPTDPTKPDTDRDGLRDEVETHTGIFVGASDTGTNPTVRDTDGDGANDQVEVTAGTHPLDAGSIPMPPLRIMPLGDSITAGYTDNPAWNEPFNFGYRSGLYTLLKNAGYHFQFVGGSPQPWNKQSGDPSGNGTVTPALDLRPLGQDHHEGYGGTTISATEGRMAAALQTHDPDVILLMVGINGIGTGSPAELASLINATFSAKPDIRVIVAQITPLATYNANLFNYNTYIRETLVPSVAADGFKISTVDMYSMFLTNPANGTSINPELLANRLNHPTNAVYDQMAQVWFEGVGRAGLRGSGGFGSQLQRGNGGVLNLRWASKPGKLYTVRSHTGLSESSGNWPVFNFRSGVVATPPENSISFPMPPDPRRFFVVEEWDEP